MRRFLPPLTLLILAAGCDRRPSWAKMPESGTTGESTITGKPLDVKPVTTPGSIKLDGKLDDAIWNDANVAGPFVGPGNGEPAEKHPVAGFAKLAWDDSKLYVGAVIEDRNPTSPFKENDVDPHIWSASSAIELMIQPGDPNDNRDYYEIQVDVAKAVFDTRWDDYNRPITGGPDEATKRFGHMDWSSKVERAVHVETGKYWSVEMAIPFSAFDHSRFPVPPQPGNTWRVNLYSFRDGQRLALAWSPIRQQGNFHKSSRFGRITFVK